MIYLHLAVTSSLLAPNILFSTLLFDILNLPQNETPNFTSI